MLSIKNLTVKVNDKTILKDFNLDIKDGEVIALMGPNGMGKSTICKVIMGDPTYQVINGNITYNGENILDLRVDERSKRGIYLLNQNPIEIEGVRNADMLRAALEIHRGEHIDFFKFDKEIREVCRLLDIPYSFIHRGINEGMSGGEKKKNELLHLYMIKPKLILLDELDSGLDIDSLKSLSLAIKDYLSSDISLLIITHHMSILEYLKPDKVAILKDGAIAKIGDINLAKAIEQSGFRSLDVSESENYE